MTYLNLRKVMSATRYRFPFSTNIMLCWLVLLLVWENCIAIEIRTNPPYEPENPWPFKQAKNVFLKAKVTCSPLLKDKKREFAVDGEHHNRCNYCGYKRKPIRQMTIELEKPQKINTIRLWNYWIYDYFYQYYIEGSVDGVTWMTLADQRTNNQPATANGEVLHFSAQQVQYVRVTFTDNSYESKPLGRVVEIQGYALDSEVLDQLDRWKKFRPGLHGSFGSIDRRYDRDRMPCIENSMIWSGTAWRGERVNAKIVLWTADGAEQVRFNSTALRRKDGREIPASAVRPQFVRYVLGDGNLMSDVLDTADRLDISARSTRPIWVSIDVPRKAKAGLYHGKVNVAAENGELLTFEINLEVLPFVLPGPSKWSFHLDLWQNPYSVARYHHVQPWSKEHFTLLEPILKMLAEAGQKCVTATIVYQPWGGQTYEPYGSMIEWIRRDDGTWSFDYTVFDQYVKFCAKCGIKEQINCYSLVPWSNRFRYFDQASGDYKFVKAEAGTEAHENHWRPFLVDFVKHLKRRGWLKNAAIAMDERPLDAMQKAIAFMKETAPQLKIAFAGKYHPEIKYDVHDFCIFITPALAPELISERVERSLPTTFYVCCSPSRPNTFVRSAPAESTWLGWYTAAQGYTGFLRWAYNSWVQEPLYDTSHVSWTAGDCFLVYPGPRSSIRFERLREGIADYEKIRILRQKLRKSRNPKAGKLLQRLDEMLTSFSYKAAQETPCADTVNTAKKLLVEISREIAGW